MLWRALGSPKGWLEECLEDFLHFAEVFEGEVRSLRAELVDCEAASGHGDALGSKGLCTPDILRSVADDDGVLATEAAAQRFFRSCECDRAEEVAVVVVIPIGTESEMMIHPVVPHLDLGTSGEVASEEAFSHLCVFDLGEEL